MKNLHKNTLMKLREILITFHYISHFIFGPIFKFKSHWIASIN